MRQLGLQVKSRKTGAKRSTAKKCLVGDWVIKILLSQSPTRSKDWDSGIYFLGPLPYELAISSLQITTAHSVSHDKIKDGSYMKWIWTNWVWSNLECCFCSSYKSPNKQTCMCMHAPLTSHQNKHAPPTSHQTTATTGLQISFDTVLLDLLSCNTKSFLRC